MVTDASGFNTFWLTGLSGSGKSTIANAFDSALSEIGVKTIQLDGDQLRTGLNSDLGFTPEDRYENIRRTAELAKLLNANQFVVIASLISPLEKDRLLARSIIGDAFVEVFVDTPIETCISRDVKGLYRKAINNEIPNFTGISAPYEAPSEPEIRLHTPTMALDESIRCLMECFQKKNNSKEAAG